VSITLGGSLVQSIAQPSTNSTAFDIEWLINAKPSSSSSSSSTTSRFAQVAEQFQVAQNLLATIDAVLSNQSTTMPVVPVPLLPLLEMLLACVQFNPSLLMQAISLPTADHAYIAHVLPLLPEFHHHTCQVLLQLLSWYESPQLVAK
jgi:hypothetical protein